MGLFEYAGLTAKEVLVRLHTAREGLTKAEVAERLALYGENRIVSHANNWQDILRRQFTSPFVYLLIGAAILSMALGERIDGVIILLFVAINTALGFYQEYRSEQTVKLLNKYLVTSVRTYREGKEESLDIEHLVPGDIITLVPGDKVPADVRFLESYNLVIDESVLTGESAPVEKTHEPISTPLKEIYEAKNMGFSGSIVAGGHGTAVVTATGNATEYGKTALLSSSTRKASGFEREIAQFSMFVLVMVTSALILLLIANAVFHPDKSIVTFLLFAIALAVSVIPEGLPVVITFSLSLGALKLARQKVVVKRLSAIEDLGSMEILCSDKTGTLTQNNLTVDEQYPSQGGDGALYAYLAASHDHTERNQQNNAFETAIYHALTEEQKKDSKSYRFVAEIPFDPVRKRTTGLVRADGKYILIVRGAPEEICRLCSLAPSDKKTVLDWIKSKGHQGRRILAVASKQVSATAANNLLSHEKNMEFKGLLSFEDPLKESAREAVQQAERLGVQVKVITGDSREVAGFIARQIDLIRSREHVLTGQEFEAMSDADREDAARRYHVFARVSPQQKYAIIEALQKRARVGFLGEGINDAGALKIANVALAVQGASDIAKEASDIVLLDKSLKVIIDGVREGRSVFANTGKYILATLSSNFGNFFAVAISSFFIPFLPMLPLQILLLNLLSDFPMMAVATDSVDQRDIRKPEKYDLRRFASISIFLGIVSTVFDFIFFGLFYRSGAQTLQTSWFVGSILTELLFLFSIRTRRFFLFSKPPSVILIVLTAAAFIATLALPQIPVTRELFQFEQYSIQRITLILTVVACYFVVTETVKVMYYKLSVRNRV